MRWQLASTCTVLMTAGMAAAQEAAAPVVPPPLPVGQDESLLLPSPVIDLRNLWKDDRPSYHFTADIGCDILWTRWSNPGCPAFGPKVALSVFNERDWGVGASWMQLDQSTTSKSVIGGSWRKP